MEVAIFSIKPVFCVLSCSTSSQPYITSVLNSYSSYVCTEIHLIIFFQSQIDLIDIARFYLSIFTEFTNFLSLSVHIPNY